MASGISSAKVRASVVIMNEGVVALVLTLADAVPGARFLVCLHVRKCLKIFAPAQILLRSFIPLMLIAPWKTTAF